MLSIHNITSKTFGDTVTYYTNINGTITSQYQLDDNGNVTDLIAFIYDSSDEIIGFTYDGNTYFYLKNLQGDVTDVVDEDGTVLVSYSYDGWGMPFSDNDSTIARVNPIKYRGYYCDEEIGMYYLQSRYYNYQWCRFLNSDLPEYAQQQKDYNCGINLFAYCCNDPINNVDPSGRFYADTAAAYYLIEYVLPELIAYGILIVSGLIIAFSIIYAVVNSLNNTGSSGGSSNPKKPNSKKRKNS